MEWQVDGDQPRQGEITDGNAGDTRGESSIVEIGEGGVLVGDGGGSGTRERTAGDGEGGDIAAAEEGRKEVGERTGYLRERGGEVESTQSGVVGWGKTETDGEGGLPGNTGQVHVVIRTSKTIENGGNKLLEDIAERVAFLVAQAEGSVDLECTIEAKGAIGVRNEALEDGLEIGQA